MIDIKRKWRALYQYQSRFGNPKHDWQVIGASGALHFHVTDHGAEHEAKFGQRYSAGLEVHYRQPPDYMAEQPPSHDECWVLKCPCWHDGTSLYAYEHVLPFWLSRPDDHERMFDFLRSEAEERFRKDDAP